MSRTISSLRSDNSYLAALRKRRDYEGIVSLLTALDPADRLLDPELSIALAGSLSHLRQHWKAKEVLLESETVVRFSGDEVLLAQWQLLLAIQLLDEGRLSTAEELAKESLYFSETRGCQRLVADAYNTLGVLYSLRGEVQLAVSHYNRSLIAWRCLGETQGVAFAHHNLGVVLREWGRTVEACGHFSHADAYLQREGTLEERLQVRAERALLWNDLGDTVLAEQLARHAVSESRTVAPTIRAGALRALGCVLHSKGAIEEASQTLNEALRSLPKIGAALVEAEVLEELTIIERRRGRTTEANMLFEQACAGYRNLGASKHVIRLQGRYERLLSKLA